MSLVTYQQMYHKRRADLFKQRGGLVADHPEPVATTWSLSFQKVQEQQSAAAELLRLCAFLAPDAITEDILTVGASYLGPILSPVAVDVFLLSQAIEALRAYSLVRRDPQGKGFSIHRLVQAVLQDKLEEKEKRCWAERMVLAVNAAFPPSEYGTWSQCELLLPHALQAAQWSEMYQINRAEVGRLLQETASYLRSHARYKEAEPLYQRALRIWEQQGGPEHPDVAYSLRGLANLYRDQGKYADANLLYQRTLRIWERQGGPEHPETAAALYDVASFWEAQGNTQEALSLYQRALAIQEHTLGLDHPKTIATQQRVFSSLQEPGWHENVQS